MSFEVGKVGDEFLIPTLDPNRLTQSLSPSICVTLTTSFCLERRQGRYSYIEAPYVETKMEQPPIRVAGKVFQQILTRRGYGDYMQLEVKTLEVATGKTIYCNVNSDLFDRCLPPRKDYPPPLYDPNKPVMVQMPLAKRVDTKGPTLKRNPNTGKYFVNCSTSTTNRKALYAAEWETLPIQVRDTILRMHVRAQFTITSLSARIGFSVVFKKEDGETAYQVEKNDNLTGVATCLDTYLTPRINSLATEYFNSLLRSELPLGR